MPILLLCDDESGILDVLSRYFIAKGHEVHTAATAAEALSLAAAHPPDVLVADIGLKGADGFELHAEFRREHPAAPVLFTTGQPSHETALKALRAGAFDYLVKPFHLDEIGERIERALESKRLRDENREFSRLVSLHAVANQMAAAPSHEELRDQAVRLGAKLLRADAAWWWEGGENSVADLEAGSRLFPDAENLEQHTALLRLCREALAKGDARKAEGWVGAGCDGVFLAFPVEMRSKMTGVLCFRRHSGHPDFEPVDWELGLQFAFTFALCLRALGREAAQPSPDAATPAQRALKGWAGLVGDLVDEHGRELESKRERTALWGRRLLAALNWPAPTVEEWALLCQVADLAKLRVKQEDLFRKGEWTETDRRHLRRHQAWAAERLSTVPGLREVARALEDGRERFDGSGEPRAKRGHAIAAAARLFAVIDAFVAMLSARPHRAPFTEAEALEAVRREAGTRFDPEVVLALDRLARLG